ncbi:MAG TPA: hypothetical protein VN213_09740, partial [Solirubrobacteraceae bacterium]|nr:hypothetical protein [Solirubrobacteraceae bacterium]
ISRRSPAVPVALSVLTVPAGALATLLVAYRLADPPGDGPLADVHGGAWLGLGAALVVVVGGYRSMRAERLPGAGAPSVQALPAPPP